MKSNKNPQEILEQIKRIISTLLSKKEQEGIFSKFMNYKIKNEDPTHRVEIFNTILILVNELKDLNSYDIDEKVSAVNFIIEKNK
ncbi:MAG: hypothetical protein PF569_00110 [Candidatus Woesearchaeota archaeon]|jgi:hypothetical protein|nr:hypothetical protein [Candidatus Woesearchaeota archaeon]